MIGSGKPIIWVSKIMVIWTQIHGKNPWDENHRISAKSQGTSGQPIFPVPVAHGYDQRQLLVSREPPNVFEKSRPEKCVTIRKESCIYSRQDHAMKIYEKPG